MKLQDMEWTLNRIIGLKCCITCKRYRRKDCIAFHDIVKYLRRRERRYTRIEWIESIGSCCGNWI